MLCGEGRDCDLGDVRGVADIVDARYRGGVADFCIYASMGMACSRCVLCTSAVGSFWED